MNYIQVRLFYTGFFQFIEIIDLKIKRKKGNYLGTAEAKLKLDYVKYELMNLKFYHLQFNRVEEELEKVMKALQNQYMINTVVSVHNRSVRIGEPNWMRMLLDIEQELMIKRTEWESKCKKVNEWLGTLSKEHQDIVNLYVIHNRCCRAEHVANSFGYSKEGLLKIIVKAMEQIAMLCEL